MKITNTTKRTAQRQHINLSNYAYKILQMDTLSFFYNNNISGLINTIFLNFYAGANASISIATERHYNMLVEELLEEKQKLAVSAGSGPESVSKNVSLSSEEENVLKLILDGYSRKLIKTCLSYDKQHVLKIRLQNDVYDILYDSDGNPLAEADYYKTPADYIKAILEEYSLMTYSEREYIIFKRNIDVLESEISSKDADKHIITITNSKYSEMPGRFNVKPYFLGSKSISDYHFLLGLACPVGNTMGEYVMSVFRISMIENIQIHAKSFGSSKITASEVKKMELEMKEKDIQHITEDLEDFTMSLTPAGLAQYFRFSHLRPITDFSDARTDENGNTVLSFRTTEQRMLHYFLNFGADAKCLEPARFAEKLKEAHRKAYENYL